jgi:predicted ATPase
MPDLPSGTVTFLFTDIEGSTRLLQELGAGYADALATHRRLLREAFTRHGGVEVDTQGDAFFVAFARAGDAVTAADEAQRVLADGPVRVRIGIHTGEPTLAEEGYVGMDVHRGARIAAAGHGGQILFSQSTRELLDAQFDIRDLGEHRLKDLAEPEWLFQLGQGDFPPLKSLNNTNLPRPASSFIGRERELEQVVSLLRNSGRLVTLTGPGGSGKTRLAIEAAAELLPDYRNGVFWVGLAALRDPGLVTGALAQTLAATGELSEHISERELLLLLDNFEQVVEAAPQLSALLESCPNLRLLLTSRELLRVQGEIEYAVPPLPELEAVELFCARSQLEPNATIAGLCRHLDNLPLAVELAAARTSVLSPAQILERLSHRLDLLKGRRDADPRQQTLRATIEWSYDLLADREQRLFQRLSVFLGGCTLQAAEEIVDADLDTLQSLVEKSLVRHADERFWMLETTHEYALERFEQSDEAEKVQKRHASYFLAFVEDRDTRFPGREESLTLEQLNSEHDNLRAALRSAIDRGDAESALRLAIGLQRFWRLRGHLSEGRSWLEEALATGDHSPRLRAQGLRALANVAGSQGDAAASITAADEALRVFRARGDVAEMIDCLNALGAAMTIQGDLRRARCYSEESEQLANASDDTYRLAVARGNLGDLALYEGAYGRAQRLFEQSEKLSRELGLEREVAIWLGNAGLAALHLTQFDRAAALLRESLALSNSLSYVEQIVYATEGLGAVLAGQAEWELAVKVLAGAQTIAESIGIELQPFEQQMHDRAIKLARSGLAQGRFDAAWAAGEGMPQEEVISHALGALG